MIHEYGRVQCIAPGCGKRRVHALVIEGIRFCDAQCAYNYLAWLSRITTVQIAKFQGLRDAIMKVNETAAPPVAIYSDPDAGGRIRCI